MLEHLGIARAYVLRVECLQECGVEDDGIGIAEHTHLVFQATEVDARLAANAGVDHGEQGGGDVDVVDTPLERRGGEASQVGHHAPTYIY